MNKTICITGVAGFIGSNLADRLLREGYRVLGIDNLSYGVREQIPGGVGFHELDIRSEAIYPVIAEASIVFHLAAKNCISDCQLDPVETVDINVRGTTNVFEAARLGGVEKVVYAESSALYEGSPQFPTPENDPRPESFYALSKYASMLFAEGYARYYGVKSTALRYFNVYGPRQDYRRSIPPVFSAFIIALLREERPVIYGSGEKRRDFVYVEDVNDFHLRCIADDDTTGRVFNLGSGTNNSINEIYAIIARLVGSDVTPEYRDNLPGEAEVTLADITRASSLGWSPKTSLEEGLAASVEYIRKNVL